MKLISFSLYGDKPKYTLNAIINCIYAEKFFYDWNVRFYHDDTVPENILQVLSKFKNVQLVKMERCKTPVYWRLLALEDTQVDVVIFRDADSWVSKRDKVLIDQWLSTEKEFHIVRDHCHHRSPIMAGTWGAKTKTIRGITNGMLEFVSSQTSDWYHNDQIWLNKFMYPIIKKSLFVHGILNPPMENDAVPIPEYQDEEIPGYPLKRVTEINASICSMCGKPHTVFIGSQLTNLTGECYSSLRELAKGFGVELNC